MISWRCVLLFQLERTTKRRITSAAAAAAAAAASSSPGLGLRLG
jgi:hypothetical protein